MTPRGLDIDRIRLFRLPGENRDPGLYDQSWRVEGVSRLFSTFAQDKFLDFAGGGFRQLFKQDMPGVFEVRQMFAAPFDDFLCGGIGTGAQFHEGAWCFAPFVVRPCHYCCGLNGGVLVKHVLNFDGGDIFTPGNNDVSKADAKACLLFVWF